MTAPYVGVVLCASPGVIVNSRYQKGFLLIKCFYDNQSMNDIDGIKFCYCRHGLFGYVETCQEGQVFPHMRRAGMVPLKSVVQINAPEK